MYKLGTERVMCIFVMMRLKLYAVGATNPLSNILCHPTDPTCTIKIMGRSIEEQGAVVVG